ncbi:hypothetical protein [Clostridium cylindrosporum]|uniref:hypothetical protein n=1 Tax=Clostridium cylindrosporum TaxID=1495 RepID=UPI00137920C0|nr:hypothetical protein [Clostridium cylindrosporum]
MEFYLNDKKQQDYKLPSGFVIITNNNDLYNKNVVFKSDGTLNHRATTLKVRDVNSKKEASVTLTIGYTRIMRVN